MTAARGRLQLDSAHRRYSLSSVVWARLASAANRSHSMQSSLSLLRSRRRPACLRSRQRPRAPLCSSKEEEGPRTPLRTAAQELNGVVAPLDSYKVFAGLLVHEQDRHGHFSSHNQQAVLPSRSRDFDPRRVDYSFVTPFGLWASLRHSIFTTSSMPFWRGR